MRLGRYLLHRVKRLWWEKELTMLHKTNEAMQMLAYDYPTDSLHETLRLTENTALLYFYRFFAAIVKVFEKELLRAPIEKETKILLQQAEHLGFLRMIRSIKIAVNGGEKLSHCFSRTQQGEGKDA